MDNNLTKNIGISVFVTAYAVFMGASYLIAFWWPFNINIFTYLSFSDFITSALSRVSILILMPLLMLLLVFRGGAFESKKFKIYSLSVIIVYIFSSSLFLYRCIKIYIEFNEKNDFALLYFSVFLIFFSIFVIFVIFVIFFNFKSSSLLYIVPVILLLQTSSSISLGYRDGYSRFHGIGNHMYLADQKLCIDSTEDKRWIYLSYFGGVSFFVEKENKNICIIDDKKFILKNNNYEL